MDKATALLAVVQRFAVQATAVDLVPSVAYGAENPLDAKQCQVLHGRGCLGLPIRVPAFHRLLLVPQALQWMQV